MQQGTTPGEVRPQAVQRAIDAIGSALALAMYLGVTPADLLNWMSGGEQIPERHFLRMVDIICDDLGQVERRAFEAARRATFSTADWLRVR